MFSDYPRHVQKLIGVCKKTTDGYSRKIPVLKGVHQGNILSPTLFDIFINDITTAMTGNHSQSINTNTVQIPCLLYADDILILSQTKTGLQNKLNRLYDYCSVWGLQINRDKTKVIIFTHTDPKLKLFFKCGDDKIETTDSYKYLGIIFHKSESFTNAQDHLAKQANRAAQVLRRTCRNENIRVDAITQLLDSLVLPILTYGSEVWDPYTKQLEGGPIEQLFKSSTGYKQPHGNAYIKFCRQILGVHNKAMR